MSEQPGLPTYSWSPELDKIAPAVVKLHAQTSGVKKGGTNPHFRSSYTRLEDAWAVLRPLLGELDLAVIQSPVCMGDHAGVTTQLLHASGQWVRGDLLLPAGSKLTPQAVGSAISYARRYALLAMCGLATDDDDGEAAMAPHRPGQGGVSAPQGPGGNYQGGGRPPQGRRY